jgi:hypothetical protein
MYKLRMVNQLKIFLSSLAFRLLPTLSSGTGFAIPIKFNSGSFSTRVLFTSALKITISSLRSHYNLASLPWKFLCLNQ